MDFLFRSAAKPAPAPDSDSNEEEPKYVFKLSVTNNPESLRKGMCRDIEKATDKPNPDDMRHEMIEDMKQRDGGSMNGDIKPPLQEPVSEPQQLSQATETRKSLSNTESTNSYNNTDSSSNKTVSNKNLMTDDPPIDASHKERPLKKRSRSSSPAPSMQFSSRKRRRRYEELMAEANAFMGKK